MTAICERFLCRIDIVAANSLTLKSSALDRAWKRILGREGSKEFLRELQNLFPGSDHLEDWQLTPVHKIVLGLSSIDLVEQLNLSAADINTPDSHGRTPLWWSVRRKDLSATSALLKLRADPHIADHEGISPLHCAAIAGETSVTQVLLHNGANPGYWTPLQGHPLRIATRFHDDPEKIEPFISPEVDLDDNTVGTGPTSLHRAASEGHAKAIRCLLQHTANINVMNKAGNIPLFLTCGGNHVDALRVLLEGGADHTIGHGVLHYAAQWTISIDILDVLQSHRLQGINVAAKDQHGMSALDAVEQSSRSTDFKVAFRRLVEAMIIGDSQSSFWTGEETVVNSSLFDSNDAGSSSDGESIYEDCITY